MYIVIWSVIYVIKEILGLEDMELCMKIIYKGKRLIGITYLDEHSSRNYNNDYDITRRAFLTYDFMKIVKTKHWKGLAALY